MREFNLSGYRWYSIDPSINNIGIAIYKKYDPIEVFTLKTHGRNTVEKIKDINRLSRATFGDFNVDSEIKNIKFTDTKLIIIEEPETFVRFQKNKYGRIKSRALNVDSVIKLSKSIGALVSVFSNGNILMVKPKRWKSNMSKEKTQILVRNEYPNIDFRWDLQDKLTGFNIESSYWDIKIIGNAFDNSELLEDKDGIQRTKQNK